MSTTPNLSPQSSALLADVLARRKPTREIDATGYALTDEELLTTETAAQYLGFQPVTLKKWRYASRGPVYLKLGQSVRYHQADLDAWQSEQQGTSAGEAAEQ